MKISKVYVNNVLSQLKINFYFLLNIKKNNVSVADL